MMPPTRNQSLRHGTPSPERFDQPNSSHPFSAHPVGGGYDARYLSDSQDDDPEASPTRSGFSRLPSPSSNISNGASADDTSQKGYGTQQNVAESSVSAAMAPMDQYYYDRHIVQLSPSQQSALRKRIKDAMKDMSQVEDHKTADDGDAHAVRLLRYNTWPEYAFDEAARSVLETVFLSQAAPQQYSYLKFKYARFDSAMARLERAMNTLRKFKSTVKTLMDPPFVAKLCDAPDFLLKTRRANNASNRTKAEHIKVGKDAKKVQEKETPDQAGGETSEVNKEGEEPQEVEHPESLTAPDTTDAVPESSKRKRSSSTTAPASRRQLKVSKDGSASQPLPPNSANSDSSSTGPTFKPTRRTSEDAELPLHERSTSSLEQEIFSKTKQPPSSAVVNQLAYHYGHCLCEVLKVDPSHAYEIRLNHLRIYARAYNGEMKDVRWYYPEMPAEIEYGLGELLYKSDGTTTHFVKYMPISLHAIAHERQDTTLDLVTNPNGPGMWYYDLDEQCQRALGMTPNFFGEPEGLGCNAVDRRDLSN